MATASALPSDQRGALLAAKLRALVSRHPEGTTEVTEAGSLAGAVTLAGGGRGWVYVEEEAHRALGPALAWARRRGLALELVDAAAAGGASVAARRAVAFRDRPRVWSIAGTELAPAEPAPYPELPAAVPEAAATLVEVLAAEGVEVVLEDGQVVGEVLGLEVARVVVDDEGEARLEVGVGRYDREVVSMVHGGMTAAESLATVAGIVRRHRAEGAPMHQLNRLAPERWLRALLVADPGRIGLADLVPLPSVAGRRGLREIEPAAAVGRTAAGSPVVVVCSVGIDLDVVPAAADARAWWAGSTGVDPATVGLRVVVPERDAHPVTADLVAALDHPGEVVTVPATWRG